jgi:RNA polymerase sigma factor (sigma-70 family)
MPTFDEVCASLGVEKKQKKFLQIALAQAQSHQNEESSDANPSDSWLAALAIDDNATLLDQDIARETLQQVQACLNILTPRERSILEKRTGLDGLGGASLKDIGEHFRISKERVRQIEAEAIEKIRRELRRST